MFDGSILPKRVIRLSGASCVAMPAGQRSSNINTFNSVKIKASKKILKIFKLLINRKQDIEILKELLDINMKYAIEFDYNLIIDIKDSINKYPVFKLMRLITILNRYDPNVVLDDYRIKCLECILKMDINITKSHIFKEIYNYKSIRNQFIIINLRFIKSFFKRYYNSNDIKYDYIIHEINLTPTPITYLDELFIYYLHTIFTILPYDLLTNLIHQTKLITYWYPYILEKIIIKYLNHNNTNPPEVTTLSSTRRGASSNYLSLKGNATPGDRGGGNEEEQRMLTRKNEECQPLRTGNLPGGTEVVNPEEQEISDVTSSGENGVKEGYGDNKPHNSDNKPHDAPDKHEGNDVTSGGEPAADLREAEGEVNKEGTTPSGKTSGGEADGRTKKVEVVTSGVVLYDDYSLDVLGLIIDLFSYLRYHLVNGIDALKLLVNFWSSSIDIIEDPVLLTSIINCTIYGDLLNGISGVGYPLNNNNKWGEIRYKKRYKYILDDIINEIKNEISNDILYINKLNIENNTLSTININYIKNKMNDYNNLNFMHHKINGVVIYKIIFNKFIKLIKYITNINLINNIPLESILNIILLCLYHYNDIPNLYELQEYNNPIWIKLLNSSNINNNIKLIITILLSYSNKNYIIFMIGNHILLN